MPGEITVQLIAHPAAPPTPLRGISVDLRRDAARLRLRYRFAGDVARLRLPAPAEPALTLGLWEHTCGEAFVAAGGAEAYHELNFSPSREWAVLAFSSYRELAALGDVAAPRIDTSLTAERLELAVEVDLASLAPLYATAALRLGLAAVVEADDGGLSYWALAHPPGKADFHHHSARAVELPAALRGGA